MKLETLLANQAALGTLGAMKFDDVQLTWDLADAIDEALKALEKFNTTRNDYVKVNGTPNEESPGNFKISDPEKFNTYIEKLVAVDVKVTFPTIPFSAFEGSKLSANDVRAWKALGIIAKPKKGAK